MNWFKKMRTAYGESRRESDAVSDAIRATGAARAAIDILMRNACDMDKCWPDLERTGLSKETLSRICNLTIIACAQDALEAVLDKHQIPGHYVFVDQSGTEQAVRFDNCDIYLAARAMAGELGQEAVCIGAKSRQLNALALCADRLGGATREHFARVLLLPLVLPPFGLAEAGARILPGVGGASQAIKRRTADERRYFKGNGIDVGGGIDSIDRYAAQLGFDSCRNWDLADGDAQYLAGIPDGTYDFLHSSHCLEHMVDPQIALINWVRVVRPGGYIVVVIPDEEMYEHLRWPSAYNDDHKWSFTIYRAIPRLPKSVNVFDLLTQVWSQVEIIKVERIEAGYRHDFGETDQTALGTAECSIEFVLRKISAVESSHQH
jgi:SAM-dependent methyltransferase